jgi:hypothetical protein
VSGVKYQRNPKTKIKEIGDDRAVYIPATRAIHVLNQTALLVWELADEPVTAEEMAAAISSVTDTAEQTVLADLREVLPEFVRDGILIEAP